MKKSLFCTLTAFFMTAAFSAFAIPSKSLEELHNEKKINDKCFSCIDGQLPIVEAGELSCLMSKIMPGQSIETIISEFKECTNAQLSVIEKACASDCMPQK